MTHCMWHLTNNDSITFVTINRNAFILVQPMWQATPLYVQEHKTICEFNQNTAVAAAKVMTRTTKTFPNHDNNAACRWEMRTIPHPHSEL